MTTKFVSGETLPVELRLESPAAPSPALRRRSNAPKSHAGDNARIHPTDSSRRFIRRLCLSCETDGLASQ
jgi:hypothetical protein